jgi:polyribonucleotide nucleotidyltransferase
MPEKISFQVGAGTITVETGKLAKQADGCVTVQLGETIVLVAAVAASKAKPGQEFFPLTVDYREKAAAAGKFPGGYFKREGRPTEKEILTCRLIDRPIRPLFPKGWYNEVQVQTLLLSADGENDPDIISIIGASAALSISDIPWAGPLGAVRVGRVNGEFIANPTHVQMTESDLDLVYVGNETDVVMFEGSAKEISDADFNASLVFAQEACQPIIAAQKELAARAGKKKRDIVVNIVPEEILDKAKKLAGNRMVPALLTPAKLEREAAVKALQDEIGPKLIEKFGAERVTEFVLKDAWYYIQKEAVRGLILNDSKRLDGRGFNDIRAIVSEAGIVPRAHGSAMFQRGETQAVVLTTLGTTEDAQNFDSYTGGATEKRFILQYNFPNYSVGETGRISPPGRREIGHGALAERSIEPVVPTKDFPYAIRVTCEITESNGSSSMASVCGGVLALMDAGVPLIRPVAGISIGICTEHEKDGSIGRYKLLSDIIGWEDAFCDMDCKIAGTEKGITGFQLDLKLKGLPHKMMAEAVESAREGRMHILAEMAKTLAAPRAELSKYAPRIVSIKINPEKIGALIGPGGKNIKRIVEESGCEINIDDDGTVNVYSVSEEGMKVARAAIEGMTAEVEIDKIYRGRVVSLKEFGCFVEVFPGKDGLVHISELANFRVKMVEDIVKMGDEIWVKCIGIDEKGRVKLSRRAAMEDRDRELAGGGAPSGETPAPDDGDDSSGETDSDDADSEEIATPVAALPPTGDVESRPRERAPRERSVREPRAERPERPERPAREERPARAERPERPERPARDERPIREERAPRDVAPRDFDRPRETRRVVERTPERLIDRPERAERSDRPERSDRFSDRPERTIDRPERSDRGERSERPILRERAPLDRPDRGPRDDRSPRDERGPAPRFGADRDRGPREFDREERAPRDDRGPAPAPASRGGDRDRGPRDDRGSDRPERAPRDLDRGPREIERAPREDRGSRDLDRPSRNPAPAPAPRDYDEPPLRDRETGNYEPRDRGYDRPPNRGSGGGYPRRGGGR